MPKGGIWICHWEELAGDVPAQRQKSIAVKLPVPLVTSCAFAGDALDTLTITTATVMPRCCGPAEERWLAAQTEVKTGHKEEFWNRSLAKWMRADSRTSLAGGRKRTSHWGN